MKSSEPAPELSAAERRVLLVIREHLREYGRAPTDAEGAEACGWKSGWAFGYHVKRLIERGVLRRGAAHRSLQIVGGAAPPREWSAPYRGLVSAGGGAANFAGDEERLVMHDLFPEANLAVFRVRGDSMIGALIRDGDYVIVREEPAPKTGDKVVVALGDELVLKVYREQRGSVWLWPCNSDHQPIPLNGREDARVLGVLSGVIRKEGKR